MGKQIYFTEEEREEARKKYQREYHATRYKTDPEFKARKNKNSALFEKKKSAKWWQALEEKPRRGRPRTVTPYDNKPYREHKNARARWRYNNDPEYRQRSIEAVNRYRAKQLKLRSNQ